MEPLLIAAFILVGGCIVIYIVWRILSALVPVPVWLREVIVAVLTLLLLGAVARAAGIM